MDWWNNNYYTSYQEALRRRRQLPSQYEIAANDNDSWYNFDREGADKALQSQQGSAIAGGILAGLNGLTTIVSNIGQARKINDTSAYEGMIDDLYNAGNQNYNNYAQLSNDYAQLGYIPDISAEEIRGMTTGQKIGNVGSSTLSGAMTGWQVGGVYGAIAGAAIGLGSGIGGVLAGDARARNKELALKNNALTASEVSRANMMSAHERIGDNMHRQNVANVVANGGSLKKQSITEFADSILSNRNSRKERNAQRITRTKGEGGTIIRIRVK